VKIEYIGVCHKDELPFRRDDTVIIPKGTLVRHRGQVKPAGRTYKVKVTHCLSGWIDGLTVHNPKVCWAGSGGYWSEVELNDILEANL